MALRLKKQHLGPSFLLVFLLALPLARQLAELLVQAPLEVGSLGGIQGFVLGAAAGVQDPFPADPLPRVGLGLLPTAVGLAGENGQRARDRPCGNQGLALPEPATPFLPALHPPEISSHHLQPLLLSLLSSLLLLLSPSSLSIITVLPYCFIHLPIFII